VTVIVTEAIVVHAMDYLESSRIYRLVTRDAGVQSVIGRGARSPRARFGSAMGLFASGSAQISVRDGRDLHNLNAFDVTDARSLLASDYQRFMGASVLAEFSLRFATTEATPELYDCLDSALQLLGRVGADNVQTSILASCWRFVSVLGFAPALVECANCHGHVPVGNPADFSHSAGGVVCSGCAGALLTPVRRLPPAARTRLGGWCQEDFGADAAPLEAPEFRAHGRLLREFVTQHVSDDRPLRALAAWLEAE
jgi:DNA repair protein RecO (recombination protein O)